MDHRNARLGARQCAGERRVGVAIDEHDVGSLVLHHRLELCEHRAGLRAVRSAADVQMMIRRGDAELLEEDVRHPVIVVLAGVHQHFREAAAQRRAERRRFDELRARSEDGQEFHAGARCGALWGQSRA